MKTITSKDRLALAIGKFPSYKDSSEFLINSKKSINIKLLAGSMPKVLISALFQSYKNSFFVIAQDNTEAENWFHDLSILLPDDKLALMTEPKKHVRFQANDLDDHLIWLIDGLSKIQKNEQFIAIATPAIFDIPVPKSDTINQNRVTVKINQTIPFNEFTMNLALNGFDKKDFVSAHGDMAIRGGIIDIFPIGWDNPLRIEFWGDEIESIREFNPLSQRSIRDLTEIEFIANIFLSSTTEQESTILDFISEKTVFIMDSPEQIYSQNEDFEYNLPNKLININPLTRAKISIKTQDQPKFDSSINEFTNELRRLAAQGFTLVLTADGKIHLDRFRELVESSLENSEEELELDSPLLSNYNDTMDSIIWLDETYTFGFFSQDDKFALFTEHQVFNRERARLARSKGKRYEGSITLQELKQLNIGDYVVHSDKGVGKFLGFERIEMGGNFQDCVKLAFMGEDILYVHMNYIQKIQKYSSQEGVIPKLSKLGSAEWARKKARTKKKLKDIARDLIKLYAQRKESKGYSYPEDTLWQKEFEASFMYDDTPDQARTTEELKKNMEDQSPMDLLVCGDVGFGKTEIAIRAAFKAVQAGKQVAILVPTTILAQQHYMTFRDRLQKYPVNIDAISRFRSVKKQREIVEQASEGRLDIVIGTHRILSKDIKFKDLGLLIIDEEHRFGVSAKEKLRQMKGNVDTLTLTATPIPRTLNFSLMGARDLSIIETPPRNRLPVSTEILEWKDEVIINAIDKEMERGGQIFFVSDRVHDLEKMTMNIQMLMPHVRFGIAHGQMKTSELEKVMEGFIDRKFDVLVTTKIIESGLDIPNANTILINRSQNFGLAELYQLRGRVGRSNTQAYCYLLIPPVRTLAAKSLRRLQAIEEFTDLGSGFQLAMRDMEIRGAGNLLGAEQSGFIIDMGFELFQKILDEAVSELRAEEFAGIFDQEDDDFMKFANDELAIQLDTDALFPSEYIKSDTDRFYFYKRLYNSKNNKELESIVSEIRDRFGKLPKEALELIFAVKIRMAALPTGFSKVVLKQRKLVAEFPPDSNIEYYQVAFPAIVEYIQQLDGARMVERNKKLLLEVPLENRERAVEIFWRIKQTLENELC
jgi:transcription-repair coupling factor (superfamily II helicase)